MQFNIRQVDKGDVDATKIRSVTLYEGRDGIVVKLEGAPDLGLEWPAAESENLRPVDGEVFVYCEKGE